MVCSWLGLQVQTPLIWRAGSTQVTVRPVQGQEAGSGLWQEFYFAQNEWVPAVLLCLVGWVVTGARLWQLVLKIPLATHSGPTLGTDVLVVPGVGVKDGADLSISEVPQLPPMSHSKLVRKEVLPHLMGRAPQMGVSASVPKVGSPVTSGQILSCALPPCSCCLESQGGCRDRASAFTSPSKNAQTQLSGPFPIFLSLPLTTPPIGTPSEAPAWPHQPDPLTRAPIAHLSLCPSLLAHILER